MSLQSINSIERVTPVKTLEEQNFSIIRGFILLKPKIFAHIIAVRLSFFFLSPQALDSLASARLEFGRLCQNRPISSALKKKLFKGLGWFEWGGEEAAKLFCNFMAFCFCFFLNKLHLAF